MAPVPAAVLLELNPGAEADLTLCDLCGVLLANGIFAASAIVRRNLWQLRIS